MAARKVATTDELEPNDGGQTWPNSAGQVSKVQGFLRMAVLIRGSTICPICGRVIEQGQEAISFAAFVPNERDPLRLFHDAAVHSSCLETHPLVDQVKRRWLEFQGANSPAGQRCAVCREWISDPDDYVGLAHFSDDPTGSLFPFNYLRLHRSHLTNWPRRQEFLRALEREMGEGRLRGSAYEWLLQEISGAV